MKIVNIMYKLLNGVLMQMIDRLLTPTRLEWGSRIAMVIVYFWFGILKVLEKSPADKLVEELHAVTIEGLISYSSFFVLLGVVEVAIGILFLLPKFTRAALVIFLVQMFTTFGPLVFLSDISWTEFGVPTLAGQYILKNVVLVMLGLNIYYLWLKGGR